MELANDTHMPAHQIINAHCLGTSALSRERFLRECLGAEWNEVVSMIEGMLAEPWHLTSHQEKRLREFRHLLSEARAQQPKGYAKLEALH